MRMYDPRIARFISVDPLAAAFPWYSPYQFAGNKPTRFIDLDGMEEASPEAKDEALRLVNAFAVDQSTQSAFTNIHKGAMVASLINTINNPASIRMDQGGGYYCGLYAASFLMAYRDPVAYSNAVIELYKTGSTSLNGNRITASSSLRGMTPNAQHVPSAFILSAAMRETDNSVLNYTTGNKFWSSTSSGTFQGWMSKYLGMGVSTFSYGYEMMSDGIADRDLPQLAAHLNSGLQAVSLVDDRQFASGTGTGSGAFYGNHFIVLTGDFSYSVEENCVSFNYYDDHVNSQITHRDMPLDTFKDMTNKVVLGQ